MILKADQIAHRLTSEEYKDNPLIIAPEPDVDSLRNSGSASLDIRLGTWFLEMRKTRTECLRVRAENAEPSREARLPEARYTPFGVEFILHPDTFVLGITLEWLRLPTDLAGYLVGKSSWGRRGLIIATAVGIHPGFTGCLTLEICNVGEIPIAIKPGMPICQMFLHEVKSTDQPTEESVFAAHRKPVLGTIEMDEIAKKLSIGLV